MSVSPVTEPLRWVSIYVQPSNSRAANHPWPFADMSSRQTCMWMGMAPMCQGECPMGWMMKEKAKCAEGNCCMVGEKARCCKMMGAQAPTTLGNEPMGSMEPMKCPKGKYPCCPMMMKSMSDCRCVKVMEKHMGESSQKATNGKLGHIKPQPPPYYRLG